MKRIINNLALSIVGLIVIYALFQQLGLTASVVLTGALVVVYLTIDEEKAETKSKEEAK